MHAYECLRRLAALATLAAITWVVGCESSQPRGVSTERRNFSRGAGRYLQNVDIETAREAAEQAFRQYFTIDPKESSDLVWKSLPVESDSPTSPTRLSDRVGGASRRHRVMAELRLIPDGANVIVRCVAENQRLETADRTAFMHDHGDSRPGDTPTDRRSPVYVDARYDWVVVNRDTTLEQKVLSAVERFMAATKPAG
jgi:hypothetical protein